MNPKHQRLKELLRTIRKDPVSFIMYGVAVPFAFIYTVVHVIMHLWKR